MQLPHVNQAVVLYHRPNPSYGKLVAFVSCQDGVKEQELLRDLARLVPGYMVPSRLTLMPNLPKTANGKVDRQKLRAMLDA